MKKASLALLFLCAGLGVFAQSGVIREAIGVVEIKSPGDEKFAAAKTGAELSRGTIISTGFRSFATVEIGYAFITLKPLSCLTLVEAQAYADAETLEVNLQTGRVRVVINPPEGKIASMSVISSMAAVSAGGTSFEFDTRNIYVNGGVAGFTGKYGPLMRVAAGASSRIRINAGAANSLERKTAGLFPSPLAGMDVIGGSVRAGVPFTIGLDFFHE